MRAEGELTTSAKNEIINQQLTLFSLIFFRRHSSQTGCVSREIINPRAFKVVVVGVWDGCGGGGSSVGGVGWGRGRSWTYICDMTEAAGCEQTVLSRWLE